MTKQTLFTTLPMIAIACFMTACSDDKGAENSSAETPVPTPATSGKGYSAANPILRMSANSQQKLCHTFTKGQRVQFTLSAMSKLHFGMSHGQAMGIDNPVPLHATRSEVRALIVKNDGEHCFHFDNRENQTIDVTFSHKIL